MLFRLAARSHLVDHLKDRRFVYELGARVDVQKNSIGEQPGSCHVARPHLEVVLWNRSFLVLKEKFRQFSDLLKVLGSQY